jgi:hypothetical protein
MTDHNNFDVRECVTNRDNPKMQEAYNFTNNLAFILGDKTIAQQYTEPLLELLPYYLGRLTELVGSNKFGNVDTGKVKNVDQAALGVLSTRIYSITGILQTVGASTSVYDLCTKTRDTYPADLYQELDDLSDFGLIIPMRSSDKWQFHRVKPILDKLIDGAGAGQYKYYELYSRPKSDVTEADDLALSRAKREYLILISCGEDCVIHKGQCIPLVGSSCYTMQQADGTRVPSIICDVIDPDAEGVACC